VRTTTFVDPFQIAGTHKRRGVVAGTHKRHGPLKHIFVKPAPHSPGGTIIGGTGKPKGHPPGKHGSPGGETSGGPGPAILEKLLEAMRHGLVMIGDVIQLVIDGFGNLYVTATLPLINACKEIARQMPPNPMDDGGIPFEHWLNEHDNAVCFGIFLAALLAAVILA
jgi:hypothetical protein